MSESRKGLKNHMFGVKGSNHPKFGYKGVMPAHSIAVIVLVVKTKEEVIFLSQSEAATYIEVSRKTVQNSIKSGKVIKNTFKVRKLQ
jgi:hypothetical protein